MIVLTERQSLVVVAALHAALFAALSFGLRLSDPVLPPDDPVPVDLVDIADVPTITEPPKPSIAAAPQETVEATAPEPEPEPPAPAQVPEPEPAPIPEPTPTPKAPKPPPPEKAKPEPAKPVPPKAAKAKPAPQRLDAEELSTLLDRSLPKAKTRPLDTSALAKTIEKALPRSARVDARATATLAAAIRAQVAPCWNPPIGAADAGAMTVVLHVEMNRDGSVVGRPGVVSQTGITGSNSDYARAFAETARRAVLRCAPLKLPAELYDQWRSVEINFDPREMVS